MPTIWMNRTAVKGLKKNGDNLFTLAGQFVNAYSDVTIHTFHETRPLNGTLVGYLRHWLLNFTFC